MNKLAISVTLPSLLWLLTACALFTDNSDAPALSFEKETLVVNGELQTTWRSGSILSVALKPETDPQAFMAYISGLGLQLLRPYSHEKVSGLTSSQLQGQQPVVLQLPANTDPRPFWSFSEHLSPDSFAGNPFITFALPAYTRTPDNPVWYYPTNIISVKPATEAFSPQELSAQFNLTFLSQNAQVTLFTFADAGFSHGSPYKLSRQIFESGEFAFVVPYSFNEVRQF